ncbi:hypothetical protein [Caballeronia sp. INML2]|jgi:hypothetical protein|uniref:hypothetical protein n=1 Tax=Caballeronia sp. INML2 TaxID=2921748 RepID=UPI002028FDBA|nr:hypothetical protein [Caballeronia sp. INML2]
MTKEAIVLNGDKVRFRIAELGIPRKQLLAGMHGKTLQRILRGEKTSLTTAHHLARDLGTTLEEIKGPVTDDDLTAWLSGHWLYEDGPATKLDKNTSSMSFVGAGTKVIIDSPPIGFGNPFAKLLALRPEICRKLVVRRVGQTFEVEVHYFDYANHGREVAYQFGVLCRFFPLSREGDNFLKRAMSAPLKRYFWAWLRETAMANAELVEIEGEEFPTHPHAYRPLVIFSKGHTAENEVRIRLFSQLQVDFRESLIEYLDSLEDRRLVFARATRLGISITILPTVKEMVADNEYAPTSIHVFLVWSTPTGSMRLAPWRYDHRQEFAAAIAEQRWRDFYSRGMPVRQFDDDFVDDPPAPPMSADPNVPVELLTALRDIDWYDSDDQFSALLGND